ncbi:MAG: hypothetical protein HYV27_09630 [Candidatus Hydrogenedentes bacterium]|nr:hypothetical protein [Candidatus Hydrogenedentota bacterium]
MNMHHWEYLLNDYIDGKLDAAAIEAFEAELRRNPDLQAEEAALRSVLQSVKSLPREIAPPTDLWAGIESRVKNSSTAQFPRLDSHHWSENLWMRLGAIAAAALVTLGGLHLFLNPAASKIVDRVIPPTPAMAEMLSREVADNELEYIQSKALLMNALEEKRGDIDEETLALIEENLKVIDVAVEEIRVAIKDDPENPRLVKLLVATREKELNFLEDMVRVP